ncbi:helix-turn-helix domain-containing protein [Streptomyces sp. TRM 70361]|uniref:helix-turn-helix domain-containing protein n=1 Tax=Streptomyces sp. TRM 70361 TaxID=3116553 RepID=UPI002E7B88DC|nr:helix-turn-helix domain-containing protein [Streptomyces sp. TRM 70361]MEE1941013.1 helix-turn-helix domain-containing protein [Streptomyces sp. TRM 70361]
MLTLYDLTGGAGPVLRHLGGAAGVPQDAARVIGRVEPCDDRWRLIAGTAAGTAAGTGDGTGTAARTHEALAVVPAGAAGPPGELPAALRALAGRGVVAVALATGDGGAVPEEERVAAAARAAGLPVLVPVSPCGPAELQALVLRRLAGVLREGVEQRDRLLRLSARLERQGEDPGRLLRQLADECGARVRLIGPGTGEREEEWEELDGHGRLLDRVRDGRAHAAALTAGERHVLLYATGAEAPHPVLAAVRSEPWPPRLRDLVALSAGQLGLLRHPLERRAAGRRLRRTEMALRVSILQYLMVGGVAAAVRAAEPLAPGVLTADGGRLAVVECAAAEERVRVARECEEAVGKRALVVLCPADDRHVIVVLPEPSGTGPDPGTGTGPELGSAAPLAAVVRAPGRVAGVSGPEPWSRAARAYESAFRALATARQTPERITVHTGGTPLAALLPAAAGQWARALLEPLERLPAEQRDQLVHTTRLALGYGTAFAARLVGVDRTTAGKRLSLVMRQAGLDRGRLADRAVLELAFRLGECPGEPGEAWEPGGPGRPEEPGGEPPRLRPLLLGSGAARQQSERFLEPLDTATRDLLAAWIAADGAVGRTAAGLGMHRNSCSQRLERAGAALGRPLTRPGAGCHDVLWALVLTGGLSAEILHDPVADGPRPR